MGKDLIRLHFKLLYRINITDEMADHIGQINKLMGHTTHTGIINIMTHWEEHLKRNFHYGAMFQEDQLDLYLDNLLWEIENGEAFGMDDFI